ncbi:YafY family protein [Synechocystis sp. PCC 6714]|uniref:helix-turn-helix transcriptional regulator n=1 Tax=Synechocystis sp. (strain PCC 6714) TaxID=1147 RepID=UPI0004078709|nr:WYL domain-containing transcriptional regulator [Synechocystis sp. PCC 6714]AIE76207.1 Transcriptional regulator, DeoR family [Synechocystis sp. PCC 6714]
MTAQNVLSPRQLERLLAIDEYIRSPIRYTAKVIAEKLSVAERTIRLDFAFLRDRFNAPIQFNQSKGYYYSDNTWRLPTIPLTQGELFALTLGARALEAYSGSAYEAELQSSIKQLAARLPQKIWVDLERLVDERIHFQPGAELLNLDPDIYQVLHEAWRSSRSLWMRYYTAGRNEESERIVDPYYLDIYRGSNPYLVAFCHNRQAFREFRLDRIREYRILDEHFEPDPSFDWKKYSQNAFQVEKGDRLHKVVIDFASRAAPYIREREWHPSQRIDEHPNESLTLYLEVGGLQEVKRWVLGYGKDALAKSPPELVKLLQEETEAMARQNEIGGWE